MRVVCLTFLLISVLIDSYIAYISYGSTVKTVDMERLPIIRKCDCVITSLYEAYDKPVERSIYNKINGNAGTTSLADSIDKGIGENNGNIGGKNKGAKDNSAKSAGSNFLKSDEKKGDRAIDDKKGGMQEEIFRILAEKQQAKIKEADIKNGRSDDESKANGLSSNQNTSDNNKISEDKASNGSDHLPTSDAPTSKSNVDDPKKDSDTKSDADKVSSSIFDLLDE